MISDLDFLDLNAILAHYFNMSICCYCEVIHETSIRWLSDVA